VRRVLCDALGVVKGGRRVGSDRAGCGVA
jgi:hypothetical protein